MGIPIEPPIYETGRRPERRSFWAWARSRPLKVALVALILLLDALFYLRYETSSTFAPRGNFLGFDRERHHHEGTP